MLGSVVIDLQLEMCLAILPATKFEPAFTALASWATEMASCLCWTSGNPCVARVCRFGPSTFLTWLRARTANLHWARISHACYLTWPPIVCKCKVESWMILLALLIISFERGNCDARYRNFEITNVLTIWTLLKTAKFLHLHKLSFFFKKSKIDSKFNLSASFFYYTKKDA